MERSTRRRFLGATGVSMAVTIAGCSSNGDDGNGDDDAISGSDYPALDEWLTETEKGDSASNYDGTVLDMTGQDTVTVDVGAQGNGGGFAFGPPAILVSTGTTVEFSWTGEGNPHSVDAEPDEQLGESDYEFNSGDPVGGTGVQFTHTMDTAGIALYHCEPHLSIGMKGGIVVE